MDSQDLVWLQTRLQIQTGEISIKKYEGNEENGGKGESNKML